MNQYGHERLDARRFLEFRPFARINLFDERNRHVSFARQTFQFRIGGMLYPLVAHGRTFNFHGSILTVSRFYGAIVFKICHLRFQVGEKMRIPAPRRRHRYYSRCAILSLSAFVMTETELKLMASAAIMGESSHPVNGYKTPAAKGTPRAL